METFGCCSSYVECSNTGKCIKEDEFYHGCSYRKHLEAGRIFYGRNKNIGQLKAEEKRKRTELFLYCYDWPFAVRARDKRIGYSYRLTKEQFETVKKLFEEKDIPFATDTVLPESHIMDSSPACARVVIELEDQEFNILNFNSYLIPSSFAQKISCAFARHGIASRVEDTGYRPGRNTFHSKKKASREMAEVEKAAEPVQIKEHFRQPTLFELMERKVV